MNLKTFIAGICLLLLTGCRGSATLHWEPQDIAKLGITEIRDLDTRTSMYPVPSMVAHAHWYAFSFDSLGRLIAEYYGDMNWGTEGRSNDNYYYNYEGTHPVPIVRTGSPGAGTAERWRRTYRSESGRLTAAWDFYCTQCHECTDGPMPGYDCSDSSMVHFTYDSKYRLTGEISSDSTLSFFSYRYSKGNRPIPLAPYPVDEKYIFPDSSLVKHISADSLLVNGLPWNQFRAKARHKESTLLSIALSNGRFLFYQISDLMPNP